MTNNKNTLKLTDLLEFIDLNYHKKIPVKQMETIACYSYRNLQRVFQAIFNETIGEYQKRLKLEKAFKLLVYSVTDISDIALKVGYSDLQAFSKAFKIKYNIRPSEARNRQSLQTEQTNLLAKLNNYKIIEHEIVKLSEIKVTYSTTHGEYQNLELNKCWNELFTTFSSVKNIKQINQYGTVNDDPVITDKIFCRYDACLEIIEPNINLPTKTIGTGSFVKFVHLGTYETIENTYSQIFGNWLLENNTQFAESAIIEHYLKNELNTNDKREFITNIYIPIE